MKIWEYDFNDEIKYFKENNSLDEKKHKMNLKKAEFFTLICLVIWMGNAILHWFFSYNTLITGIVLALFIILSTISFIYAFSLWFVSLSYWKTFKNLSINNEKKSKKWYKFYKISSFDWTSFKTLSK
ncbi:hypothetical protein MCAL160_0236 [Mycoplasmopsis californica HAZ160_1]|uniref:Uncharacterized protein n=2 Tax=Mycoplasmopsis californica TaxID=2113 RepID=A0A059XS64_9BACT|nr:hypothetical protein [Mycoplasmopsis californica]AIA29648.1 hypothetical protein MCFN_02625 [Mycoplasmopsis californica]BAP00916.1 hypothetical protein MCAL160_0236 [Mycoplasmopsis californica HAZ160_1]BBG40778.1 hypothetical protein MCAL106_0236 [Mycoplasmopsis californica]BBG41372.1 hypothetical protein MCAL106E_0236 [Mycoplasmopsis californica]BBG41965.1 hypothetical protein MCAL106L_0236 [Mycoplasmopsis californica]